MFNLFNLPLYPTLSPSFSNCLFLNPIPLFFLYCSLSPSISIVLLLSPTDFLPLFFLSLLSLFLCIFLCYFSLCLPLLLSLPLSLSPPLYPISLSPISLSLSLSLCISLLPCSLLMSLNTYDLNLKVPVYHWQISYCHIASCIKLSINQNGIFVVPV